MTNYHHVMVANFMHKLLADRSPPFEWSKNDCCTLFADLILFATDIDIMKDMRGKYHDAHQALTSTKDILGYKTPTAYLDSLPMLDRVSSPFHAGDICLIDKNQHFHFSIYLGSTHVSYNMFRHLNFFREPFTANSIAWRINKDKVEYKENKISITQEKNVVHIKEALVK